MNEEHPLDNPAWNSLTTRHKHLGVIKEKAALYQPEVSMIAGLSENTEAAYTELASIAKQSIPVAILRPRIMPDEPPYNHPDWNVLQHREGVSNGLRVSYQLPGN